MSCEILISQKKRQETLRRLSDFTLFSTTGKTATEKNNNWVIYRGHEDVSKIKKEAKEEESAQDAWIIYIGNKGVMAVNTEVAWKGTERIKGGWGTTTKLYCSEEQVMELKAKGIV